MSFVALTPNPAIDRTLRSRSRVTPASLHRIESVREAAGGKGVNVARVLAVLGAEVVVAGFLAGFNGQKFRSLLAADGLKGDFVEVDGETRECSIVLSEDSHPTEFNEPGPEVKPSAWRELAGRLPVAAGVCYVVSGSLPPGLSAEAFGELLGELPGSVVVDSSGAALLAAVKAGVALVKPNRAELLAVMPDEHEPLAGASALYERYGVPVLLTMGEAGAAYVGEVVERVKAPRVRAVNPVASGDALLAAFLFGREQGWDIASSLRLGVAAGAENAVSGGGARLTRESVMARYASLTSVSPTAGGRAGRETERHGEDD